MDASTGGQPRDRRGDELRPGSEPPGGEDEVIADLRALNRPEARRALERRGRFFVVEGLLALEQLLGSRYPLRSLLVAEPRAEAVRDLLAGAAARSVPLVVRSRQEVADIAGFDFHRGVLATATRLPPLSLDEVVDGARRLLVVEGVNDHENLGSLFRNAAAFGVDGVVLDPTAADPLYRRSVRVSMGHVLRVPWARLPPGTAAGGLDDLHRLGFTTVALTPSEDAEPIGALAAAPPDRAAVVVGSEGPGLRAATLAAARVRARIPIAAGVDSVNVATAAAIALHDLSGG